MNSKVPSSFYVTDPDGNRVDVPGKMKWVPQHGWHKQTIPAYKWELYIPHLVPGDRGEQYEMGGLSTGIEVYRTGSVSWPGKDIPAFPTYKEAMAFVEATFALENPEEVA